MSLRGLSKRSGLGGSFWRMFRDFSIATMGVISPRSSLNWINSGTAYRGGFLMLNTLEHPKDVVESTLSQVVEASAPLTFSLSQEQLSQLRDRVLGQRISPPPDFLLALDRQISMSSNTPQSAERHQQGRRQRDTEMTGRRTPSTAEEARTLFVRRLTPSECESLQGFPKGWTAVDTEQLAMRFV